MMQFQLEETECSEYLIKGLNFSASLLISAYKNINVKYGLIISLSVKYDGANSKKTNKNNNKYGTILRKIFMTIVYLF